MKQFIFLLGIVLATVGCSNNNEAEADLGQMKWLQTGQDVISVDSFVNMLKDGTYPYREVTDKGEVLWMIMPHFEIKDIPLLIQYAKDTTHLAEFPFNPISSRIPYHTSDATVILCECLLWAVDGIRQDVVYPSLDPILSSGWDEKAGVYKTLNGAELLEVWKLYDTWWKKVQGSDQQIKDVNPLEGTSYKWY